MRGHHFVEKFQPTVFTRFSLNCISCKTRRDVSFFAAFNHHMSAIEEQKELFDKYTKRLQVVRELKEQQSVEYQGIKL